MRDVTERKGQAVEIRALETFLRIVECGSFSQAAAKLGYSQPAVTMQVKQLERELGARLFDRIPHGVRLTDEGRRFSFHANEVLSAAERAADAVRPSSAAGGRELVGTLRIGGVESVSTALLPDVLAAFAREHPHVRLEVRATRGDYLAELARANEIDLFYTLDRKLALRGFERSLIRAEDIVFAAKPDVCSGQKPLEPSELARLPFVLTERGESYRSELDRALAEHDCSIEPVIEAGNTETLVHLAERDVGIAFLPRYAVENSFTARTLAPVPTTLEPVCMWVQSFRHREKWVTPAMAAFAELAERMIGEPGMQRDQGGAA